MNGMKTILFREDWIGAIQQVADRLQVLNESDLSPSEVQQMEAEASSKPHRSKKVVKI